MTTLVSLLAVLSTTFGQSASPAPASNVLQPEVRRISLFKNGIAYLELSVELKTAQPWVEIELPARPLHGSLTVGTDPTRLSVEALVASKTAFQETREAVTVMDLLVANVGREMSITTGGVEVTGRLISFPRRPAPNASGTATMFTTHWSDATTVAGPPRAELSQPGGLILFETAGGMLALSPASVTQIQFTGTDEVRTRFEQDTERDSVRVHMKSADPGDEFTLHYMIRGLAWAPSYNLVLGAEAGQAQLSARTDLFNDGFDLESAPTQLVSGFPNLKFSHVGGALGLTTSLEGFIAELSKKPTDTSSPSPVTQNVYSNFAFQSEGGFSPTSGGGFEGVASEDLYFTKLGALTLAKGARSSVPLFESRVPVEEVFRWEIPNVLDDYGSYRYRNQERPQPEVWHSLRITNSTGSPWTTAPMTVIKDGRLLGQDLCHYTPSGGKTVVKVTQALGVRPEESEREVEREVDVVHMYGSRYDRITLEGTLYLCNYKDHAVTVEISKTLSGEILEASEGAEINLLGRGMLQVNSVSQVHWRAELPAREELRLHYRYVALARR